MFSGFGLFNGLWGNPPTPPQAAIPEEPATQVVPPVNQQQYLFRVLEQMTPGRVRLDISMFVNLIKTEEMSELDIENIILPNIEKDPEFYSVEEKRELILAIIDRSFLSAGLLEGLFKKIQESKQRRSPNGLYAQFLFLANNATKQKLSPYSKRRGREPDDDYYRDDGDYVEDDATVVNAEVRASAATSKEYQDEINEGDLPESGGAQVISKLTAILSGHGCEGKSLLYDKVIKCMGGLIGKPPGPIPEGYDANYEKRVKEWESFSNRRDKLYRFLTKHVCYTMAMPAGVSALMIPELTTGNFRGYTSSEADIIIGIKVFQSLRQGFNGIQITDDILKITDLIYRHSLRANFKKCWTIPRVLKDDAELDEEHIKFKRVVEDVDRVVWKKYDILAESRDRTITLTSKTTSEARVYRPHDGLIGLFAVDESYTIDDLLVAHIPGRQVVAGGGSSLNQLDIDINNFCKIGRDVSRTSSMTSGPINAGSRLRNAYKNKLEHFKTIGRFGADVLKADEKIKRRLTIFDRNLKFMNDYKFKYSQCKLSNILSIAFLLLYLDDDETKYKEDEILFSLFDPACRPYGEESFGQVFSQDIGAAGGQEEFGGEEEFGSPELGGGKNRKKTKKNRRKNKKSSRSKKQSKRRRSSIKK